MLLAGLSTAGTVPVSTAGLSQNTEFKSDQTADDLQQRLQAPVPRVSSAVQEMLGHLVPAAAAAPGAQARATSPEGGAGGPRRSPRRSSPTRASSHSPGPGSRSSPPKARTGLAATAAKRMESPSRQTSTQDQLGRPSRCASAADRDKLHQDLYQDAFARQQRLKNMKEQADQQQGREERLRQLEYAEGLRQRRRFYRASDRRTHLEREEEVIRRRKETQQKNEAEQRAREEAELTECTFKPSLHKHKRIDRELSGADTRGPRHATWGSATFASTGSGFASTGGSTSAGGLVGAASGSGFASAGSGFASTGVPATAPMMSALAVAAQPAGVPGEAASVKLKNLIERQRATSETMRVIASEEATLREKLRSTHAELYDSILREETQKVVQMLQDPSSLLNDGEGGASPDSPRSQQALVRRVRSMVASGGTPEAAQKIVVDELVGHSREEVQRRVLDIFLPMRFEAEGNLNMKRLACVHDLEAVEAMVSALRGGTLCEEAKAMGFEFGCAERARQDMQSTAPSLASSPRNTNALQLGGVRSFGHVSNCTSMGSLPAGPSLDGSSPRGKTDRAFLAPHIPSLASVFDKGVGAADAHEAPSGCHTPRSQALVLSPASREASSSPARRMMQPVTTAVATAFAN